MKQKSAYSDNLPDDIILFLLRDAEAFNKIIEYLDCKAYADKLCLSPESSENSLPVL